MVELRLGSEMKHFWLVISRMAFFMVLFDTLIEEEDWCFLVTIVMVLMLEFVGRLSRGEEVLLVMWTAMEI